MRIASTHLKRRQADVTVMSRPPSDQKLKLCFTSERTA
jgi:hypothetical protein